MYFAKIKQKNEVVYLPETTNYRMVHQRESQLPPVGWKISLVTSEILKPCTRFNLDELKLTIPRPFFFQSVFEYRFSFLFCSFFGGSLFLGLLSPFLLKPLTLNDKICSPNPRQQKYISSQQEYKQVYLYVY